jgi:hypothetical protein
MSTFNIITNTADCISPGLSFSHSSENYSMRRTNLPPGSPNSKRKEMKSAGEKKPKTIGRSASGGLPVKSRGTTVVQLKPAKNPMAPRVPSTSTSR